MRCCLLAGTADPLIVFIRLRQCAPRMVRWAYRNVPPKRHRDRLIYSWTAHPGRRARMVQFYSPTATRSVQEGSEGQYASSCQIS